MSGRKTEALKIKQAYKKSSVQGDELAAYAFDMLQTLRETCSDDKHRFLSYLIGMAAEEAQRLAEGLPSAAAQFSKQPAGRSVAKKH
ncbi:MAG: hypothetical protein CMI60_12265 [Parvibaculum sp.]|jgi:hypothetical protein|nr:hypothetical protein [Parvibaculum sp.]|tara:strand:- start:88 stop:348 length:261 start_codon:yes stop_codon:yes gene_type:complete